MSDGVRNRPPMGPSAPRSRPVQPQGKEATVNKDAQKGGEGALGRDVYEQQNALQRTAVKQQIQAVASRALSDLQFSNQDMAYRRKRLLVW